MKVYQIPTIIKSAKKHMMLRIAIGGTLLLGLVSPLDVQAAENVDNIIVDFENDVNFSRVVGSLEKTIIIDHKISLDELQEKFPKTLTATMQNGTEEDIEVEWSPLDDYENVIYEQYAFLPEWDEDSYRLSDTMSDWDVPYIEVIVRDESHEKKPNQLILELPDGNTIQLDCYPAMTVRRLKNVIASKTEYSVEEQYLYYNETELEDEKVLQDYRIWEEQNYLTLVTESKEQPAEEPEEEQPKEKQPEEQVEIEQSEKEQPEAEQRVVKQTKTVKKAPKSEPQANEIKAKAPATGDYISFVVLAAPIVFAASIVIIWKRRKNYLCKF